MAQWRRYAVKTNLWNSVPPNRRFREARYASSRRRWCACLIAGARLRLDVERSWRARVASGKERGRKASSCCCVLGRGRRRQGREDGMAADRRLGFSGSAGGKE